MCYCISHRVQQATGSVEGLHPLRTPGAGHRPSCRRLPPGVEGTGSGRQLLEGVVGTWGLGQCLGVRPSSPEASLRGAWDPEPLPWAWHRALPCPESRLEAGPACPLCGGLLRSTGPQKTWANEGGGSLGASALSAAEVGTPGSCSPQAFVGPTPLPPIAAPRGSPVVAPPTWSGGRAWLLASPRAPREGCLAHQGPRSSSNGFNLSNLCFIP